MTSAAAAALTQALFPELDTAAVQAGKQAKQEAMERVESHAPISWLSAAKQAGRQVAGLRPEFTTDPMWKILELQGIPPPHEKKAMGPVTRALMKAGVCVKTGRWTPSVRPECNRRPVPIYRSLIYRGSP